MGENVLQRQSLLTLLVGAVVLIACILIFRKWDLPGWLKRKLGLQKRWKAVVFVFVVGVFLAFLTALICSWLQVAMSVYQIINGVVIGFVCAMIVGIITKESAQEKQARNARYDQTYKKAQQASRSNKGRRSKG